MKMNRFHKQSGATLMEVLVAMTISLIATSAMIAMMSNSLGTTARIIKMTKLTDDMRVALQMMSRDVRRSNYNANSMFCYANDKCGKHDAGTVVDFEKNLNQAGDVVIDTTPSGESCLTFLTDRDHNGDSSENSAGGFRQVVPDDHGVGVIEMWVGNNSPDCSAEPGDKGWVEITNPDNMDIFAFSVDELLSYDQLILDNGTDQIRQKIRKIRMNIQGRLVIDNSIIREVEDIINVRNDILIEST